MIISNHQQGTPEWLSDRIGLATGSKADVITAKGRTKGSESTQRRNYRFQLALERITGKSCEKHFTNDHMERGKELEKFARMAYEIKTGEIVEEVGFCISEDNYGYGCSVDGFVEDRKGIVEIKCPIPAIHYEYIENNNVPMDYINQIIHNMIVTGAEYCDFISYNEDMPDKLRLFVFRFIPTEDQIDEYSKELVKFLEEVNKLTEEIKGRSE